MRSCYKVYDSAFRHETHESYNGFLLCPLSITVRHYQFLALLDTATKPLKRIVFHMEKSPLFYKGSPRASRGASCPLPLPPVNYATTLSLPIHYTHNYHRTFYNGSITLQQRKYRTAILSLKRNCYVLCVRVNFKIVLSFNY